jgi:N-acetylglucosamine kinase-like BadF-type ATPase
MCSLRYFLGVDVGATKTHALIADEAGDVVSYGATGPGNHEVVGYAGLRRALHDAIGQALKASELSLTRIVGAGFGVAGYDWHSELADTQREIDALGLTCPMKVVNDTVIALAAGASQGWGVVVIAGTGTNARGRDRQGREGRVTGNGIACGEFGGGGEMVWKAVHAVCHAWTRCGPETQLTQAFMQQSGAPDAESFIEGMVLGTYHPNASWAPLIFQVAEAGDAVAHEVIAWTARELGGSAIGVIRQLDLQQERFDVVMAGSIFKGGDLYIEPLREAIQQEAPGARLVRLDAPPVVGGLLLGMEAAGFDGYPLRQRLIDTARALMEK